MEPMYVSIRLPETGNHIKQLLKTSGYTVKDIQSAMGFENPQAIYKWMSGKSLPSLDNLLILSKILHSSMEDILVVDGDVVLYIGVMENPIENFANILCKFSMDERFGLMKNLSKKGYESYNSPRIFRNDVKNSLGVFRKQDETHLDFSE